MEYLKNPFGLYSYVQSLASGRQAAAANGTFINVYYFYMNLYPPNETFLNLRFPTGSDRLLIVTRADLFIFIFSLSRGLAGGSAWDVLMYPIDHYIILILLFFRN